MKVQVIALKINIGNPKDLEGAKLGTTAGKRKAFRCLMSNVPVTYDYIRAEGKAGRMCTRLMAIVAEVNRGRVFLSPQLEHEEIARTAKALWMPEMVLPDNPRDFKTPNYGMTTFADLFTSRQLMALNTFSEMVQEVRERFKRDALTAGLPKDDRPLCKDGVGAQAYADAVCVYLGLAISRWTDLFCSLSELE